MATLMYLFLLHVRGRGPSPIQNQQGSRMYRDPFCTADITDATQFFYILLHASTTGAGGSTSSSLTGGHWLRCCASSSSWLPSISWEGWSTKSFEDHQQSPNSAATSHCPVIVHPTDPSSSWQQDSLQRLSKKLVIQNASSYIP